ncbi:Pyrroline-5-carboxylate reductase [Olea europaea subsp. europaea]|uniref:Pyrroline-5-carboxylate reductase n=1 Tax=Olea europaea subsp. europaea TaxID=158383 RepID=A0A8S0SW79_OLEEU|nr:Pyrroline-5-carboxylate reductase [Olea europaea subsp. europaea]
MFSGSGPVYVFLAIEAMADGGVAASLPRDLALRLASQTIHSYKDDGELISKLFGAIREVWTADKKLFDAITGLSGSGPVYVFLAIEAMADGGVAASLPRDLALRLASQAVLGDASMTVDTEKYPGQLKDALHLLEGQLLLEFMR